MKFRISMIVAAALLAAVPFLANCGGGGSEVKSGKQMVVGFAQTGSESGWRNANFHQG